MSAFGTNVPCVIPFSDGLVRSWESFWERVVSGEGTGCGMGHLPSLGPAQRFLPPAPWCWRAQAARTEW